jgi:predicted RNA methylase
MKEILINYPIKFLQLELINIRTSYRLEKKKLIEILREMKSINKLSKEDLIDLLIKYNYDISKLPKLEDLIKPKKEPKPKAKKEEAKAINNIFKDIPKLDDIFKQIDKKDKYKAPYSNKIYKYTDKDKQVLKDIIKKMYEIIDKFDVIKRDLLFIKYEVIIFAKLNNENIDRDDNYINYNNFIDKYLLSKLNNTLSKLEIDKFDIFTGTYSFDDIIRQIIDSFYISNTVIYKTFDSVVYDILIDDKYDIKLEKKDLNNTIEKLKKQELKKQELKAKKEELEKLKVKQAEKDAKDKEELEAKEKNPDLNKIIEIPEKSKKTTTDEFIKIRDDIKSDIDKYLPIYLPLFNINDLLSLIGFTRQDIKRLNIFLTPSKNAEELIDYSYINAQYRQDKYYNENLIYDILEPTAGTGNLIAELINDKEILYRLDAIEYNKELYHIGKARFKNFNNINWYNENFLDFKTDKKYDFIFMNPPFNINVKGKKYLDIDFVNKAYKLLKENGRLCAILSNSYMYYKTPIYKKFNEFVENNGKQYKIEGGFKEDKTIMKEMQTNVKMMIIIIDKNEEEDSIF